MWHGEKTILYVLLYCKLLLLATLCYNLLITDKGAEAMPTTYPTELKVKTIRRYEKGESIKALSQKLHISQSTLYQWRKEYCSIKAPNRTYTPAEFDAISRRLQRLEHHMEIIRQTGYLSNIPLQKKLATLEELYNRAGNPYSVHELCDALDVARGTFYNHIFRRADRSKYQEEQAQLMLQVKQVFDDSEQRFGAEKIRIVLAGNGIHVSKKRISAIMQELGLCSVRTDAKKQFKRRQQYAKQNLLKRKFSADHPNQIWVSDITYFKVKNYWVYPGLICKYSCYSQIKALFLHCQIPLKHGCGLGSYRITLRIKDSIAFPCHDAVFHCPA